MLHELGHAIGLRHEHARPDRDNYLSVRSELADKTRRPALRKMPEDMVNTYGVKYDYSSLLHYKENVSLFDDSSAERTKFFSWNPELQLDSTRRKASEICLRPPLDIYSHRFSR